MPFDAPVNASDASFQRAVVEAPLPVIAVFWSPGQTVRQVIDPVLEQTAEYYAGDVLVVRLDVQDAPDARRRYNVDQLPEFLFFRDGRLVARAKGVPSTEALRPWVDYLLERGPKPATAKPRREGRPEGGERPLTVTDATFDQVVLNASLPALVDFWAAWCGPCRAVAPTVEALATAYAGRAVIAKLDVDANQGIARRYGVMSIPTLIFFRNGQEVDRVTGAQPKDVLQQRLEALL